MVNLSGEILYTRKKWHESGRLYLGVQIHQTTLRFSLCTTMDLCSL